MRIIAGKLKGRQFEAPSGHRTHPMSEKIRGALFNALGDITGLTVLDAFAGSGALSFEAVSRGAAYATAIEINPQAHRIISENIRTLGIRGNVKSVRASTAGWLTTASDAKFDIVLLDPPYDNVRPRLLADIAKRAKEGGVIVASLPPGTNLVLDNLQLQLRKSYGDAELLFYKNS
jgi:16S rRNA (guanine966-N2)-methyltransferase